VKEIAATPFGSELEARGWIPVHGVSPYGPLWTQFEAGIGRIATGIPAQVLSIKLVVVAFSVGTAAMIWLILGIVAPRSQFTGVLIYLWNPVVIVELAGEGHNDAAMLFFVLLSLWLVVRARQTASAASLAFGALVKIVAVMIAPLQLAYAWRTQRDRGRLAVGVAAGAVVAIAVAAFFYAPFWIGSATLEGLRAHSRPAIQPSTQGVMYWYLTRTHSETASAALVSIAMTGLFAGYVAWATFTVRDAASLMKACGRVAVLYLVVAPGYWPWYAAMPVALLALAPNDGSFAAVLAVSLASRLAAPIDILRLDGAMDWTMEMFAITAIGVWLPAALLVVLGARRIPAMWRDRAAIVHVWRGARPTFD
jgi:hypothetical protein